MRTAVLFINFTQHIKTPVYAPTDTYVKRLDISESIHNPGDADEVDQLADAMWKKAEHHVSQAIIGGDSIIVALPGTTLMAAAMTARIQEIEPSVGVITATRNGEEYVFDLSPSRILLL